MGKYLLLCTDFLFARPSFLSGLARTLDLHGDFDRYNVSRSEQEADSKALLCDWLITMEYVDAAWNEVARENPDYIQQLAGAARLDPYLAKEVARLTAEAADELQVATTQGK